MARNDGLTKRRINTATTTQVKLGNGRLLGIVFNTPVAASTVTLIDGDGTTNNTFGVITNTSDVKAYAVPYNVKFSLGLRITTSSTDDITVIYE